MDEAMKQNGIGMIGGKDGPVMVIGKDAEQDAFRAFAEELSRSMQPCAHKPEETGLYLIEKYGGTEIEADSERTERIRKARIPLLIEQYQGEESLWDEAGELRTEVLDGIGFCVKAYELEGESKPKPVFYAETVSGYYAYKHMSAELVMEIILHLGVTEESLRRKDHAFYRYALAAYSTRSDKNKTKNLT